MKRSSAVVLVLILVMVLGPLAGAFDKTLKVNVLDVAHLSSFNSAGYQLRNPVKRKVFVSDRS